MILNKNRKLVRWAYLFRDRPDRTTLCAFFWQVVLISPIAVLIYAVASPVFGVIWLLNRYVEPILLRWEKRRIQRARERRNKKCKVELKAKSVAKGPSTLHVLWQGLKAVKGKVCPLIVIE